MIKFMMCLSLLFAQLHVQNAKASAGTTGNIGAITGGVALVAACVVILNESSRQFHKPDATTFSKIMAVASGVVGAVIGLLGTIALDAENEKNSDLELTEITVEDGLKLGLSPEQVQDQVASYNQELDEIKLAVNAATLELKNIPMSSENKDQLAEVYYSKFANISPQAMQVFETISLQLL